MADVRVMKRGNVYQYQFEIEPVDGKKKYINKSGFKTKKEAFDKCNECIAVNSGMADLYYHDYDNQAEKGKKLIKKIIDIEI